MVPSNESQRNGNTNVVAEFSHKESCPECGSRDNLARYDDGSGYCFGCTHTERADSTSTYTPKETRVTDMIKGEVEYLPKRGLSEETCEKFKYKVGELNGKKIQIANYTRDGKIVCQKIRDKDKNFITTGDSKAISKLLFGQDLWRDAGKRLIICEGEIDAMSVSQAQGNKWPVVSVPCGAQTAAKAIANNIEWVERFDQVIFCFDSDDPGIQGAKEAAAVLSPGKAYIATLPLKDANEMLQAKRSKELIDALWGAKQFRPDGIVDIASLEDDACADIEIGRSWPWPSLTAATYGRRRAELYGFGAGTGIGKSTVFKQIATHIIQVDNLPVGLLMLEEPPKITAKTIAGMMMGKRVHVPGVEYDKEELKQTVRDLGGKVYLYDHFGSMSFEVIREKIRYMVRALGIRDIFLDHLTALAASIDHDQVKAIDKIMAELSSLTQELDCTIYYVSHLATPEGKSHEEGGRVLERHFRGSRSIAMWSHYMFALERDKQSNDPTTFRVLKDRYTGDATGVTFGLRYNKTTGLYEECELHNDDDRSCAQGPSSFQDGGDF